MPNDDYNSEFTGGQIDELLKKARDAELYAQRAERALYGVEEIAGIANEILKKITINTDSIGMQKTNFLPLEDGEILEGGTSKFEQDAETGAIVITPMDEDIENYYNYDEKYGEDPDLEDCLTLMVTLQPGTYKFRKSISSNKSTFQDQATITTRIFKNGVLIGNEIEITSPSTIEIEFWVKVTHGHYRDYDIRIWIYPFLCRSIAYDEPFEPYKPDLQTQINELRAMIEAGGGYNETQVDTVYDSIEEVNND